MEAVLFTGASIADEVKVAHATFLAHIQKGYIPRADFHVGKRSFYTADARDAVLEWYRTSWVRWGHRSPETRKRKKK